MDNKTIPPIETVYNGYRFRSRLEARWAVFFDALGVKYEYEPEGYVTSTKEAYLPDFYLPQFNCFAEVKGKNSHMMQDFRKIADAVRDTKISTILLSNIPFDEYSAGLYLFPYIAYLDKRDYDNKVIISMVFFVGITDGSINDTISYPDPWLHDFGFNLTNHINAVQNRIDDLTRIDTMRGTAPCSQFNDDFVYEMIQAIPSFKTKESSDYDYISYLQEVFDAELPNVQKALAFARQARFEHGEKPQTQKLPQSKHFSPLQEKPLERMSKQEIDSLKQAMMENALCKGYKVDGFESVLRVCDNSPEKTGHYLIIVVYK